MPTRQIQQLLREFTSLPGETKWVEFKHNRAVPEEIGETISALSNSAALLRQPKAYMIWGVDDATHSIQGTSFDPHTAKKGNQELESWLVNHLSPRLDIRWQVHEVEERNIVLLEIPSACSLPVRFKNVAYIRVGSYTKALSEYPEKERALWSVFKNYIFEQEIALPGLSPGETLNLLDYPAYFNKLGQSLPENREGIIQRLAAEGFIVQHSPTRLDITNVGAILFANDLSQFDRLSRKALRVVIYTGDNRINTIREIAGRKGYAVGFEGAVEFINNQLPQNEEIGQALRRDVRMYPTIAIRELVANALIHQDFSVGGAGPMVEIFANRIEIANPGKPLIETMRFIDMPPRSRNEIIAAFLRRINICEERGSGIDKVVNAAEFYQLPPPDFRVVGENTVAVLYTFRKLAEMDHAERLRACYQHACLRHVSSLRMTNATLRKRFGIEDKNYSIASRIIAETTKAGLVKPYDPGNPSKKLASYLPYWA